MEGGLRLTDKESALGVLDSGATAVLPGDWERSELWRRVSSPDPAERMPPEGPPLAD